MYIGTRRSQNDLEERKYFVTMRKENHEEDSFSRLPNLSFTRVVLVRIRR